jgi:hypothetical protein
MSIRQRIRTILAFSAAALTAGCAITLPASETLIFRPSEKRPQSNRHGFKAEQFYSFQEKTFCDPWIVTDFSFPFERGYLQLTSHPRMDAELEYAKRKFAGYIRSELERNPSLSEEDVVIRNPYYLSLAFPILLLETPDVKWNLNFGTLALGSDLTARLRGDTFLTVNLGYGDGELIIQHKVVDRADIGVALGGFYRTERRGLEIWGNELDPSIIFGALADVATLDRVFYNHLLGGRAFVFIPVSEATYAHCVISPAYALNLNRHVLNIGIGLRWDLFRE